MVAKPIRYGVVVAIFGVLVVATFSYIMNCRLDHDEHMYVTAGVLIRNHALYKDFAYLQMPYVPMIYGAFYALTGTSHYLLWGRMFTFVFMLVSAAMIYLLSHKFSRSTLVSTCLAMIFLLNEVVVGTMGHARNNIMPMALSLIAFYLFIRAVTKGRSPRTGVFACGVCLALAMGAKLYYLAAVPPFVIVSLFYPRSQRAKRRITHMLLPLLAGTVLGLLPAMYYLVSRFDVFVFDNIGYHRMNARWRTTTDYVPGLTAASTVDYVQRILAFPTSAAFLAAIVCLLLGLPTALRIRRQRARDIVGTEGLLSVLLVLFTTTAIFIPVPLQIHYFAAIVPFWIILVAWMAAVFPEPACRLVRSLLISIAIVSALFGSKALFKYIDRLADPGQWTGLAVHAAARQIRDALGADEKGAKIATLAPLYAIEANLPIYNELATGPFLYRVGDLISADERKRYVATSPETLSELFQRDPPRAVLIGKEKDLEEPFVTFAASNNCPMGTIWQVP